MNHNPKIYYFECGISQKKWAMIIDSVQFFHFFSFLVIFSRFGLLEGSFAVPRYTWGPQGPYELQILRALKPEQLVCSSSICLDFVYIQTFCNFFFRYNHFNNNNHQASREKGMAPMSKIVPIILKFFIEAYIYDY